MKIFVFSENKKHQLDVRRMGQCKREAIILNTTVYIEKIIIRIFQFPKRKLTTAMKKGKYKQNKIYLTKISFWCLAHMVVLYDQNAL